MNNVATVLKYNLIRMPSKAVEASMAKILSTKYNKWYVARAVHFDTLDEEKESVKNDFSLWFLIHDEVRHERLLE